MKKLFKSKNLILLIIVVISIITITFSSVSLARYVNKKQDVNVVKPTDYVLTIDKNQNETYKLYEDSIISFNISNFDSIKTSKIDLNLSYKIYDTSDSSIILQSEFTLPANNASTKEVLLDGLTLTLDKTYRVDIIMTNPYSMVYSFYYHIIDSLLPSYYNLVDNGSWLQLDIYIGNDYNKEYIIIDISDKLAPNNTNIHMTTWLTGFSYELTVTNNTHYTLEFFELDAYNYTNLINKEINDSIGEFTIEL